MKKHLSLPIIALLGGIALGGCNAALYDSSVDINGNKVDLSKNNPETRVKNPLSKVNTKASAKNTTALENKVEQAIKSEAEALENPDYVPNSSLETKSVTLGSNQYDPLNSTSASSLPQAFEPGSTTTPALTVPDGQQTTQVIEESGPVISNTSESAIGALSSNKCETPLSADIQEEAYRLTLSQTERLKDESGPVYVSRTIIADSLKNCIADVSPAINQAFSEKHIATVMGQNNSLVQNAGQSSIIPQLIRACKQSNIPLVNVSFIRHIGSKVVITIRNIRVKDGITLVQNTKQLQ